MTVLTTPPPSTRLSPAEIDEEFVQIVDTLTRRGLLAGGVATAAVLGLAACGSADKPAAAPAATTRRVAGAYGEVTLPAEPKRIVAFPSAPLSTLLDIGVTPVGTDDDEAGAMAPANRSAAGAISSVGTWGSISIEKIAALKPDLVVSTKGWVDEKLYAQIAAVAPTLIIDDSTAGWEQVVEQIAQATGRSERLTALKKKYADTLDQVKSAHASALAANRWEIVQAADAGKFQRWGSATPAARILTALGATLGNASATDASDPWGPQVSYEDIDSELRRADVILVPKVGSAPLLGNAAWRGLPAAGHVYTSTWMFPFSYSTATELVNQVATICGQVGERG